MTRAWIGLGGNIGNVRENMITALRHLDAEDGIEVLRVSDLYRTPPWGVTDQPDFLNACAELRTILQPRELLRSCLSAEGALHRKRTRRWGPRTIDIDILLMEGITHAGEGLTVPHPRLKERAFALMPLADLAPDASVEGVSVTDWLARQDVANIRKIADGGVWDSEADVWRI